MDDNTAGWIFFIIILILMIISLSLWLGHDIGLRNALNDSADLPINTIEIQQPALAHYQVTSEEREMLARLVFLESSICSLECQKAVVSVVFNRLDSGKWGNSLSEVIYYKNAFAPVDKIATTTPNETAYQAVDYVIQYGSILPPEVRYFRASHDFNWQDYKNYCVIDNVYFGYFSSWEQGAW